MIITSPPYADQIKDYGEKVRKIKPEQYVEWFLPRAKEFYRVLSSNRSFFLNISDKLDGKFQSLYVFKLVISLCDNIGFHLVRDYIWYNPARDTAKNKLKEIAARLNEIVGQLNA